MSPKYTNKLAGQKVLIIGGTSGIGFGLAEALLEHGSSVIVSSSSASKLESTISRLEASVPESKGRVSAHACNLAGPDAPAQVAALFTAIGGGSGASASAFLDHIVYTAGDALAVRPLADWDLAAMQQAGMVRFFGPILVAQHAARVLKAGPGSSLVFTSGSVADKPSKDWAVINGFAAGLPGLVRGLALDLAPLRVNLVSPGAVETELWDGFRKAGNYEQVAQTFIEKSLTGEIGQVVDVVEAYLYLLKDRNVTGSVVKTNSGGLIK